MKKIFLFLLPVIFLAGCPKKYPRYPRCYYQDVTKNQPDMAKAQRTPSGIRYWAPTGVDVREEVDKKVAELEQCLGTKINRDWFGVVIPNDAYQSKCSGQWLVPSTPNCRLCIDQKGLPLPEKCCGLAKPTEACPCVCNMRSVVQENYHIPLIVTTKELVSFQAELIRLISCINFPWGDEKVKKCAK